MLSARRGAGMANATVSNLHYEVKVRSVERERARKSPGSVPPRRARSLMLYLATVTTGWHCRGEVAERLKAAVC